MKKIKYNISRWSSRYSYCMQQQSEDKQFSSSTAD